MLCLSSRRLKRSVRWISGEHDVFSCPKVERFILYWHFPPLVMNMAESQSIRRPVIEDSDSEWEYEYHETETEVRSSLLLLYYYTS